MMTMTAEEEARDRSAARVAAHPSEPGWSAAARAHAEIDALRNLADAVAVAHAVSRKAADELAATVREYVRDRNLGHYTWCSSSEARVERGECCDSSPCACPEGPCSGPDALEYDVDECNRCRLLSAVADYTAVRGTP